MAHKCEIRILVSHDSVKTIRAIDITDSNSLLELFKHVNIRFKLGQ